MDFATIIGFVGGIGVLSFPIHEGGGLERYYSEHAVIVIFGGSITATLIRFELGAFLSAFPTDIKTVLRGGTPFAASSPRTALARSADSRHLLPPAARRPNSVRTPASEPHPADHSGPQWLSPSAKRASRLRPSSPACCFSCG